MKLVIDRKVWLRGEHDSRLLRESDGKMCCVGIYLAACGVARDQLLQKQAVAGHNSLLGDSKVPAWVKEPCSSPFDVYAAYEVNDNTYRTNEQYREKEIAAIFAKHDVQVEFIN